MAVKKTNEIYRCEVCGNVIEVLEVGGGELVCCNKPMVLMESKRADEGKEKHIPVVEINDNKITVKVGSVSHPMGEKHWIEMIQLLDGDNVVAEKRLLPQMEPSATFKIDNPQKLKARIYCNIHGLWGN